MIFVSVGTYIHGFDELITAVDDFCGATGYAGFAQIGNSAIVPRHLKFETFLPPDEMAGRLRESELVVCHAGLGIIGDAMRARRQIITVPRQEQANSSKSPANNQLELALRLRDEFGIQVCRGFDELPAILSSCLETKNNEISYDLTNNVPLLIADFLRYRHALSST